MRVLVTGGKTYANPDRIANELAALKAEYGSKLIVIQGRCPTGGADLIAEEWCLGNNVHCASVPALWKIRHASAGPQRNAAMVKLLEPELGLAFGGDRGTDGTVDLMKKAGIPVREFDREE